jgi:DNA-binding winged helix-turn-helix (wHTH) protein/tetratricopeptide (TPR) repeat protein
MSSGDDFVFGAFRLDPAAKQLWRETRLVPLRPKLFAALQYLVEHSGRLITRDEILRAVWSRTHVDETLLRGTMRDLRASLGDDADSPTFIETIPHQGYRFLAEVRRRKAALTDSQSRDTKRHHGLFERDRELELLSTSATRALGRQRQLVFVTGEPGIGKTSLVDAQIAVLANQHGMLVGRGQCVEQHGASEPYLPMLEAISQLCRQHASKRIMAVLRQHAPTWLVQLPALLSDTELDSLLRKTQGAGRDRMLREMAEAIEAFSVEMPLAFVFEDLHWSDHPTLDLLGMLARRREPARLLIVGTYRPADVIVSAHPLRALKQELHSRRLCEEIPLGFLSVRAISEYLTERFDVTNEDAEFRVLATTIHQRTDGNPLFMVNVVDDLLGRGLLECIDGVWRLSSGPGDETIGVPQGLRQLIDRQLERLPSEDQRLLEAASVAGRIFSPATVAAVLDGTTDDVDDHCSRLAGRGVFIEESPDGAYTFLHDLYQRVLYDRLSKSRRARLHRRVAEYEVQAHAGELRERAAQLAVHFERGGDAASAIEHLKQAAVNAVKRQAFQKSIDLLRHALDLLASLPANDARNEAELSLQMSLSTPLLMAKGYTAPEAAAAAARARDLSQHLPQSPALLPALLTMARLHFTRAELDDAAALAEQSLILSANAPDPLPVIAESVMMYVSYFRGELEKARTHAEHGAAIYDVARHGSIALDFGDDPGVLFDAFGAWTLWRLGYPEQASSKAAAAIALARKLEIPYCEAMALAIASWVELFNRDLSGAAATLDSLEILANRHGFLLLQGHCSGLRGWLLLQQGQNLSAAIKLIEQGLDVFAQMGFGLGTPSLKASLAEALAASGDIKRAHDVVDEAVAISTRRGELLDRMQALTVKGDLYAAASQDDQAAACFEEAIANAQRQSAKSMELRAALRLVRLQNRKGKNVPALALLSNLYGWFTEGFDRPDLREARALIKGLGERSKSSHRGRT